MESDNWSKAEKEKFWKDKWLREHKTAIIVSLVLTPVVVLFIYLRRLVEFSILGWIALLLFLWAADLFYFNRRMREYIRIKTLYGDDAETELKQEIESNMR